VLKAFERHIADALQAPTALAVSLDGNFFFSFLLLSSLELSDTKVYQP